MCSGDVTTINLILYAVVALWLAGLTLIGITISVIVQLWNLQAILPLNVIWISLVILVPIALLVGYQAYRAAVKHSRVQLLIYAVCIAIVAGGKIYLTVSIFDLVSTMDQLVARWLNNAFSTSSLRGTFHVMETTFSCCGIVGSTSYLSLLLPIPRSCCANPVFDTCQVATAFPGCRGIVTDYLDTFGNVIRYFLVAVIALAIVIILSILFHYYSIPNKQNNEEQMRQQEIQQHQMYERQMYEEHMLQQQMLQQQMLQQQMQEREMYGHPNFRNQRY